MKNQQLKKLFLIIFVGTLVVTGCSSKTNTKVNSNTNNNSDKQNESTTEEFQLSYKNQEIKLNGVKIDVVNETVDEILEKTGMKESEKSIKLRNSGVFSDITFITNGEVDVQCLVIERDGKVYFQRLIDSINNYKDTDKSGILSVNGYKVKEGTKVTYEDMLKKFGMTDKQLKLGTTKDKGKTFGESIDEISYPAKFPYEIEVNIFDKDDKGRFLLDVGLADGASKTMSKISIEKGGMYLSTDYITSITVSP